MSNAFVGIVEGGTPNSVAVGVLENDGRRVTANSFAVYSAHLYDYYIPQPDGTHSYEMPPDLLDLARFLNEAVTPTSDVRYLLEVPEVIAHPPNDIAAVPHPVLPADSQILKILTLLGVNEVVAAPFRVDREARTAVLFPILSGRDFVNVRQRAPLYLARGTCRAYGELLGLACVLPEHAAIVGALIARNPGAFHFWSSIGQVHSSHDIIADLRQIRMDSTSVVSGMERYVTDYTAATGRETIEEVAFEYALTEQRYRHLGPNDARKAALIRVCQLWRIDLRCSSARADARYPNVEHPVFPLPPFAQALIQALHHAERTSRGDSDAQP